MAEERNVTLEYHGVEPLSVHGDPSQLRQLLTNLVDNAIKFTPQQGVVSIELQRSADGTRVELTVSDTGIGIPTDALAHVFDRFYQVDKARQRDAEDRGNGLGLSICQSIVLAHAGTISVRSLFGQETEFTVTLPIHFTEGRSGSTVL